MLVITIDGPAGSGKSTVARDLAKQLGWVYLTTGAIYRTLALLLVESGATVQDTAVVERFIDYIGTAYAQDFRSGRVFLGEREITFDIRLPVISEAASFVAQDARVREKLLPLQRKIVEKFEGAVVDGRDMGTVVFPDAILKIFLTASASERARRRLEELNKRGQSVGFQELVREIEERDLRDSTRVASPLKAAPDAILMDSTNLGAEQVIQKILEFAKTKNLGFAGVKK